MPIARRSTYEETYAFAELPRAPARGAHPGEVTTEWLKKKRRGVLVDHRQNGQGKTIASVYSVRPKPGAPVSTPLRWEELDRGHAAARLLDGVALERIAEHGDLFAPVLNDPRPLGSCGPSSRSARGMNGFVDLHTHVIPSGDDGAIDINPASSSAGRWPPRGLLSSTGRPTRIRRTARFPITEERRTRVRSNHAAMKPLCAEFGVDLRLGWELAATGALVGDLGDYVLEGTRAILLELPGPWFSFDDEVAATREQADAIWAAGFEVVLAHPERSLGVQREPDVLLDLVRKGALVCFNADSFVGGHDEACAECGWRLLDLGVGDFVASDAHRPGRPSRLREAVEAIAARHGEDRALALAQGAALETL